MTDSAASFERKVLTAPGAAERVAAMEKDMLDASSWEASDGTRWIKTGEDEWTGWVPGEDGCWLYTGDQFRRTYPEAPDDE